MRILVLNAGSSSLKFTLFLMADQRVLARGLVERIGLRNPRFAYERADGASMEEETCVSSHEQALGLVCEKIVDPEWGAVDSLTDVDAIGHRVVHGGERFTDSAVVDDSVKRMIRLCAPLAPLHNPANLGGIDACGRAFPGVLNVAVFDTAFHQTMLPSSYLYAVPFQLYEEHGLRKYGFHGTSHQYVYHSTTRFLSADPDSVKMITCHLGNGASVTAVQGGRVVDTSMGMTPLAGLVMGTRCGDLDPGVVLYLLKQGRTGEQIDTLLNKESGLLGISGLGSGDMRDIIAASEGGNARATQALEIFVNRLVAYIGSYYTVLGGAEAVVFTGGIGENSPHVRERVISRLAILGCTLDPEANESLRDMGIVSTTDSTLKAVVMPTNEELMIALETERLVRERS